MKNKIHLAYLHPSKDLETRIPTFYTLLLLSLMLVKIPEILLIGTILIAKNLLHSVVPVLKNKIVSIIDYLSACHNEHAQHKIYNEHAIGLHCMKSWTDSLLTPQVQNDNFHELDIDDSIQFSTENAMKEMDDAASHDQSCEDLQSTWER